MIWSPNNIFEHQNLVPCRNGVAQARLINCQWQVTRSEGGSRVELHEHLDIWTACRIMNDWEAGKEVGGDHQ